MKRDDILWKAALEDLFDDFLRFFFVDAEVIFDFKKKFQYLDKELEQLFPPDNDTYAPRYVDKLVRVFLPNGEDEWILVHIEVQAQPDKNFAKRMFQYFYRILDKYNKPICAFAILADTNINFRPDHYEDSYNGTSVLYKYNVFKILDQNDEKLQADNNPFAIAVLTAKLALSSRQINEEQLFDKASDLAKRLLNKKIPKDKIRNLMTFLRHYIRFENQDLITKFDQEIAILTERSTNMGIEEFLLDRAKKEGMSEGENKKATAIAIEMKKDGIPHEQIAKFTGLPMAEIEKLPLNK